MVNKATVNDEYYNAIVDSVCYWLGYQFKIGRDQLVHEASLRYPIADTITAKGIAIQRIVLEQLHPIFKSKKIDLVIFGKGINEPQVETDDENLKEVFEFKLAKSATNEEFKDEHQKVFDDVIRLAYYHLWGKNKSCYFLMCGEYEEFKTFFVGQNSAIKITNGKNTVSQRKQNKITQDFTNKFEEWKPTGLYKEWFSFKINGEKIKEFKKSDHSSWGLKPFQDNYHIRDNVNHKFSETIKIKTRCLAITSNGLENIRTHAAGLWKIEAIE